jgi:hypothetical protein
MCQTDKLLITFILNSNSAFLFFFQVQWENMYEIIFQQQIFT